MLQNLFAFSSSEIFQKMVQIEMKLWLKRITAKRLTAGLSMFVMCPDGKAMGHAGHRLQLGASDFFFFFNNVSHMSCCTHSLWAVLTCYYCDWMALKQPWEKKCLTTQAFLGRPALEQCVTMEKRRRSVMRHRVCALGQGGKVPSKTHGTQTRLGCTSWN